MQYGETCISYFGPNVDRFHLPVTHYLVLGRAIDQLSMVVTTFRLARDEMAEGPIRPRLQLPALSSVICISEIRFCRHVFYLETRSQPNINK